MGNFIHNTSIRKSFRIRSIRVLNILICLFLIGSVESLFAQCPLIPTITHDGPLTFCDGDSVVFSSNSATGNQWFKDGKKIKGATQQTYPAKISGIYTVQLSGKGCIIVTSLPMLVSVNAVPPKPSISANGPATFCSGDSVRLTSSSPNGNQWLKDGINIQGSISKTLVVKTSGSYKVIVTGASGCQSISNALVVSAINIQTPPTISPVGAVTVCSGDSVILSSSSTADNQWFRDGIIIKGAISQMYPARLGGNYTVQVSSHAGCTAESLPKTVIGGITPAIPVITASDTLINCVYSKVLYSSSSGGNLWMRNGIPLNGEFQNYFIVKTTGSYTVQVTSGSGCSSISASKTILIISNPNTPVITTSDPLSFCDGGSALLHSSTAPGYQWYNNGAPISGATSQDYKASVSGAYTVQVAVGGCSFSSQPMNVSVINQTPATISPSGPLNVCTGASVVLSSSSANGNQWYKDAVIIDGATNQTYSASIAGSYTVKINVGTCNSLFSSPVVVNTSDNPTAPTITAGGPLSFCTGGSVLLTSSTASGYQWFKNGTAIPGANDASYSVTDAGSYTVNTKNASTCQATSDAVVVTLTNSTPPPTIAVVGPGPGCGAGQTVLISSSDLGNQWLKDGVTIPGAVQKTYFTSDGGNYSVALDYGSACFSESQVVTVVGNSAADILKAIITSNNGLLYSDSAKGNQWYLNDTLIAGATDSTWIPQVSGKYTLRITNSNGCMSTFSDPYFAKIENFSSPNVSIFPNPVTDYVFIVNLDIHPVTARIFDIQGRQIMIVRGLTGTSKINLTKLSGGPYVIQVIDEVTNDRTMNLILKY